MIVCMEKCNVRVLGRSDITGLPIKGFFLVDKGEPATLRVYLVTSDGPSEKMHSPPGVRLDWAHRPVILFSKDNTVDIESEDGEVRSYVYDIDNRGWGEVL
jgi:hypothetical protein